MIRVWVARDTRTLDPAYAARDAASQALALRLAAGSGMAHGLREDEGHAEAFFTGEPGPALQFLHALDSARLEVFLIEANATDERDLIRRVLPRLCRLRHGCLGYPGAEPAENCPVELVAELRDHREGGP